MSVRCGCVVVDGWVGGKGPHPNPLPQGEGTGVGGWAVWRVGRAGPRIKCGASEGVSEGHRRGVRGRHLLQGERTGVGGWAVWRVGRAGPRIKCGASEGECGASEGDPGREVARPAGLEPATSASAGQRSNPLSYGRENRDCGWFGREQGWSDGADGGIRTPTGLSPLRPERSASASFATSASTRSLLAPWFSRCDPTSLSLSVDGVMVGDAGLEPAASRM